DVALLAGRAGREREALTAGIELFGRVGPDTSRAPPDMVLGLSAALFAPRTPVTLRGHAGAVTAAAWSADGARVITASADGSARVWDVKTRKTTSVLTEAALKEDDG